MVIGVIATTASGKSEADGRTNFATHPGR